MLSFPEHSHMVLTTWIVAPCAAAFSCCPCLMDHTGLASVAGWCWVLPCGARPALSSEFSAHWFLMDREGTAQPGLGEETPSGVVWELHPIVLGRSPRACRASVTQEYFSRFQAVKPFLKMQVCKVLFFHGFRPCRISESWPFTYIKVLPAVPWFPCWNSAKSLL